MSVNNSQDQANPTLGSALGAAGVTTGTTAPAGNAGFAAGNAARSAGLRGGPVNLNALFPRAISRNGGSEIANEFKKAFETHLEEGIRLKQFEDNYKLFVLDHNQLGIPLSLVCAVFEVQHSGKNHVGVYTFVVEASGNPLANRFMTYGANQSVEIEVVTGDVINPDMWEVIKRTLSDQYGDMEIHFHTAGGAVLPREMSPKDKEDIHTAFYNATQALYVVIENNVTGNENPFSVAVLKGSAIRGQIEYRPAALTGLGGLPIRNDVAITMDYITRAAGLVGPNTEQVQGLTYVGGYVEPVYVAAPMAPAGAYGQPGMPQGFNPYQQVPTQQYAPRYVITELDTRIDMITPETILLALISSGMITQNWAWARAFQPRLDVKKGEDDWRDIGALGWVVNFGAADAKPEKVPTKGTFSDQDLANLIGFAMFDQPMISIDIPEVGPLAWLHQMFIAAANNDQGAYQLVVDAANNLTNNQFSQIWDNSPIMRDDANRVHLGYYIDKNGEKRDLREVDNLAMLNLFGGRDPQVLLDWDRSWNDVSIPMELRLEIRSKILNNLLSGVTVKGFARRGTFTTKFLNTLTQAAQAAGLAIQQANVTMLMQNGQSRPLYNMADVALQGGHGFSNGVFQAASGNGYSAFRGGNSQYTGFYGYGQ